jgi:predicted nucleotide-binding protein (sugar kinase/HSP70/actin superfamily)
MTYKREIFYMRFSLLRSEDYYLFGCDAVKTDMIFQKNVLPLYSWLKIDPSRNLSSPSLRIEAVFSEKFG